MATKRRTRGLDGVSTVPHPGDALLRFAFALVAVTLPSFWVLDGLPAVARTAVVAAVVLGSAVVAAVAAVDGYRWLARSLAARRLDG